MISYYINFGYDLGKYPTIPEDNIGSVGVERISPHAVTSTRFLFKSEINYFSGQNMEGRIQIELFIEFIVIFN